MVELHSNLTKQTNRTTRGLVKLKTTSGDLIIDLFSRECPLAVWNFCQLVADGYYNNAPFHRIIANTLIQAGFEDNDHSAYENGEAFKDEFHSRLEFRGRGFVAMANEGKPNTNRAQFFVTLKPCPWLNRKHTIFGIIRGEHVYNALKIGEKPVDGERPLMPDRILSAAIVEQPFPDNIITQRTATLPTIIVTDDEKAKNVTANASVKRYKPAAALSFADDENEEEEVVIKRKTPHALKQSSKPLKVVESSSSSEDEDDSSSSETEESSKQKQIPNRDQTLASKLAAFVAKRKEAPT